MRWTFYGSCPPCFFYDFVEKSYKNCPLIMKWVLISSSFIALSLDFSDYLVNFGTKHGFTSDDCRYLLVEFANIQHFQRIFLLYIRTDGKIVAWASMSAKVFRNIPLEQHPQNVLLEIPAVHATAKIVGDVPYHTMELCPLLFFPVVSHCCSLLPEIEGYL